MKKRLRQVVYVARELDPLVEDLCAILGTEVAFRDPGVAAFGLKNAVLPVGDQFVEVVCPVTETATAHRYLERRRGDGGYMLLVQASDLDADEARFRDLGVRIVWRGDWPEIRGRHLHPKDTGGPLLSLDQPEPPESWMWAGPWKDVKQQGRVVAIRSAMIQAADPEALSRRWGTILGSPAADGAITLGDTSLRFVKERDDRGEGLAGFSVTARDPDEVCRVGRDRGLAVSDREISIGGMTILVRPPRSVA